MGTGFTYMAVSAIYRMREKPYVLGGLSMLWGWINSAIQGKRSYADPEFRNFLRRYQWRALLVGKKQAIAEIERNQSVLKKRH